MLKLLVKSVLVMFVENFSSFCFFASRLPCGGGGGVLVVLRVEGGGDKCLCSYSAQA